MKYSKDAKSESNHEEILDKLKVKKKSSIKKGGMGLQYSKMSNVTKDKCT